MGWTGGRSNVIWLRPMREHRFAYVPRLRKNCTVQSGTTCSMKKTIQSYEENIWRAVLGGGRLNFLPALSGGYAGDTDNFAAGRQPA